MQENCNNCFRLKKLSTILTQTKTGKHKCRNIAALVVIFITALLLACFLLTKGCLKFFRPELLQVSCILWCYFQSDIQSNRNVYFSHTADIFLKWDFFFLFCINTLFLQNSQLIVEKWAFFMADRFFKCRNFFHVICLLKNQQNWLVFAGNCRIINFLCGWCFLNARFFWINMVLLCRK